MKVGMLGAGKLGLPVAMTIDACLHDVKIYDVNTDVEKYLRDKKLPFVEEGIEDMLEDTKVDVAKCVDDLVEWAEILFVAVQTPHGKKYEGATRIPDDRKDFDYKYLKEAISQIAESCKKKDKELIVAVISTCLPGTFDREIEPLLNEKIKYVYTPQFIAMGTVVRDYLTPEFNLVGVHDKQAAEKLQKFYETINDAECLVTDITTAEAIKVSYNTFITMKTVLANTWGELCEKVGAKSDDIFKAWSMSSKRLLSPRYLRAGMGDGGGCHPRDNIALSYIADSVGLSHNIFDDLMKAREDHAEWLAKECIKYGGKKITILGRAFKPETNIEVGSPSVLVANILREKGVDVQHINDIEEAKRKNDKVILIGTKNKRYADYEFWKGVTVIDPFRYIPDRESIKVIRIGA